MALNNLFSKELKVVNIGLVSFREALKQVNTASVQVDWRPPAGGDADLLAALLKLSESQENSGDKEGKND